LVLGTYLLVRHIGSGGMSEVFAAEHVRLGKLFAVKLLRPDVSLAHKGADRLRREARAIAVLSNEYIVGIQDCGETEDGTPFLVMELLEGEDLRSLLERKRALPVARAVNILLDACRGLAGVHAQNLVHRDLKPENLFVTRHATGEDWCKVLDFGVAKMEASQSTAPGAIVGTIRYMAPEQLADSAAVGPATDVYALGAILYECLSGQPAHLGQTMQELMFQLMNKEPLSLSTLCPSVPAPLAEIVTQCLAKKPSDRPLLPELTNCLKGFAYRTVTGSSDETTLTDEPVPVGLLALTRAPAGSGWRLAGVLGAAGLVLGWAAGSWRTPPSQPSFGSPPLVTANGAERRAVPAASEQEIESPISEKPTTSVVTPAEPSALSPAQAEPSPASPRSASPRSASPRSASPRSASPRLPASAPSVRRRTVDIGKFDEANPYQK